MYGTRIWARDVGTEDEPCWVMCVKGDPGAVEFMPVDEHEDALDSLGERLAGEDI